MVSCPNCVENWMSWMAPGGISRSYFGRITIHYRHTMKSLLVRIAFIGILLINPGIASAEEFDDSTLVRFGDGSYYDTRNEDADRQAEEQAVENENIPCTIIAPTVTAVDDRTATIEWLTAKNSSGVVYVSTQPNVDIYSPYVWFASDSNIGKYHSVALTDLQPNTTYYYVITARDMWGNICIVTEHSFTTKE